MDRLPLTKDVFTLDDEDYWRFPEYLPAAEWDHLVQVVPSRRVHDTKVRLCRTGVLSERRSADSLGREDSDHARGAVD